MALPCGGSIPHRLAGIIFNDVRRLAAVYRMGFIDHFAVGRSGLYTIDIEGQFPVGTICFNINRVFRIVCKTQIFGAVRNRGILGRLQIRYQHRVGMPLVDLELCIQQSVVERRRHLADASAVSILGSSIHILRRLFVSIGRRSLFHHGTGRRRLARHQNLAVDISRRHLHIGITGVRSGNIRGAISQQILNLIQNLAGACRLCNLCDGFHRHVLSQLLGNGVFHRLDGLHFVGLQSIDLTGDDKSAVLPRDRGILRRRVESSHLYSDKSGHRLGIQSIGNR